MGTSLVKCFIEVTPCHVSSCWAEFVDEGQNVELSLTGKRSRGIDDVSCRWCALGKSVHVVDVESKDVV